MTTKTKPPGGHLVASGDGWAPIDTPSIVQNPENCKPTTPQDAEELAAHLAERMAYHARQMWRHAAAAELYRRECDEALAAVIAEEAHCEH